MGLDHFTKSDNHRISIGKLLRHSLVVFGSSLWPFYEKDSRKAPSNYSASFWTCNFSTSVCERPKTLMFTISGFRTCP